MLVTAACSEPTGRGGLEVTLEQGELDGSVGHAGVNIRPDGLSVIVSGHVLIRNQCQAITEISLTSDAGEVELEIGTTNVTNTCFDDGGGIPFTALITGFEPGRYVVGVLLTEVGRPLVRR